MGRSVNLTISGVNGMMINGMMTNGMMTIGIRQCPALQTLLITLVMTPHCAVIQHSGPVYPVLYIGLGIVLKCRLMVKDALPTNNTATTPGTPRTPRT